MICQGRWPYGPGSVDGTVLSARTRPAQGQTGSRSKKTTASSGPAIGQDRAAVAGATVLLPHPRFVTSPGLVAAVWWRAGSGPAGGGWPPAGPHRPGAAGQPPGVSERAAEQELDLGIGAAQLVGRPSGQSVVDGGVQPEQDALTFGHCGSMARGSLVEG